jgi:uncharacterized OB-fold protein
MPLLPDLETIHPDLHTAPFWEACKRRELRLQRCHACGRFRQPPLPGCPHCGSTEVEWRRSNGRGRVFSYTIVHHAAIPSLKQCVPYNVIVVELDDAPGARLISNLLDARPDEIEVGMPVELAWDEVGPGVVLPRFRRVAHGSAAAEPAP